MGAQQDTQKELDNFEKQIEKMLMLKANWNQNLIKVKTLDLQVNKEIQDISNK